MPATVIASQPLEAMPHLIPAFTATGEPVKFYDKHARLLACDDDPQWPQEAGDKLWVRGEVLRTPANESHMRDMLQLGRVMAMAREKGIVFQQKDDGNIIFYSILSATTPLSQTSTVDDVRQVLKTAFAGWHNAYHEMFALARSFSYFLASQFKTESHQLAH